MNSRDNSAKKGSAAKDSTQKAKSRENSATKTPQLGNSAKKTPVQDNSAKKSIAMEHSAKKSARAEESFEKVTPVEKSAKKSNTRENSADKVTPVINSSKKSNAGEASGKKSAGVENSGKKSDAVVNSARKSSAEESGRKSAVVDNSGKKSDAVVNSARKSSAEESGRKSAVVDNSAKKSEVLGNSAKKGQSAEKSVSKKGSKSKDNFVEEADEQAFQALYSGGKKKKSIEVQEEEVQPFEAEEEGEEAFEEEGLAEEGGEFEGEEEEFEEEGEYEGEEMEEGDDQIELEEGMELIPHGMPGFVGDPDPDDEYGFGGEANQKPRIMGMTKGATEVDMAMIKMKIEDCLKTLVRFKELRDPIRTRQSYIEELKENLCTYYGYNTELIDLFLNTFTPGECVQFLEANEQPRPSTIRTNTLKTNRKHLAQILMQRGVSLEPLAEWSKVGIKIFESKVPLGATPEYLAGHYMLQSASSFLPVMALAPQVDERVLDMAAAPGGKTTYIAQLMKNTGILLANDAKAERLKSLKFNLQRLGVTNAMVCNYDGRKLPGVMKGFDRVLLDAPCTGLGIIAKDPSIKSSRLYIDVKKMSHLQKELLGAAIDCCKPGGYVVYSTCSVTVEENEWVVDYALKKKFVKVVDSGVEIGEEGYVKYMDKRFDNSLKLTKRIYPHIHNMDGFYFAKLQKLKNGDRKVTEEEKLEAENKQKAQKDQKNKQAQAKGKKGDKKQKIVVKMNTEDVADDNVEVNGNEEAFEEEAAAPQSVNKAQKKGKQNKKAQQLGKRHNDADLEAEAEEKPAPRREKSFDPKLRAKSADKNKGKPQGARSGSVGAGKGDMKKKVKRV